MLGFRTELPAIGAKRAAHATARMLRTRVRVRAYERRRKRERDRRACGTTFGLNRVNFNCTGLMLAGRQLWSITELAEGRPDNICPVGRIRYSFAPCILNYMQKITNQRCPRNIISDIIALHLK